MRRVFTILLLSLSLVVAGAACGDDKKSSSSKKSTEKSEKSTEEASSPKEKEGESPKSDDKFSGKGSGNYCKLAKQMEEVGSQEAVTPENVLEQIDKVDEVLDAAMKVVPDEIKTDFSYLADATRTFAKVMKDAGGDFSKLTASDAASFTSPEFEAAADRIDKYNKEVCGLIPSESLPDSGD